MTDPLLLKGMFGLGDNIMQRPFVRAAAEREEAVYLMTPWPELFADLPNVFPVRTGTPLRTQRRNEETTDFPWSPLPPRARYAAVNYGHDALRLGSIAQAMERLIPLGLTPYVLDLPENLQPAPEIDTGARPLAVIRPVTERMEWHNPARNPDPIYVAEAARMLMATHHVVAVADLAHGEEWATGDLPPHHRAFLAGEIATPSLLSLIRQADVVVGGVGWIVPAAIAVGTKAWIILGGNGAHNAPEIITDPRQDLTRIAFARPDRFCRCDDKSHRCDKEITDHRARFRAWAGEQGIPL